MRKQYQVNDQGQPLTDGKPDPAKRIWDAVYLQYGAYRIVEESPTQVRVMMWAPYVYGVDRENATTTANLHIGWTYADKTVSWGRWRLATVREQGLPRRPGSEAGRSGPGGDLVRRTSRPTGHR